MKGIFINGNVLFERIFKKNGSEGGGHELVQWHALEKAVSKIWFPQNIPDFIDEQLSAFQERWVTEITVYI